MDTFFKICNIIFAVLLLVCFIWAYYKQNTLATCFFGFAYLMHQIDCMEDRIKEKIGRLEVKLGKCQLK